jgi:hypothetical protein
MNTLKQKIEEVIGEDESVVLADGFESAFIGIGRQFGYPISVYDKEKCIKILEEQGMSTGEAEEYFSFNTEGAWVGEQTPIFLETI